MLKKIWNKASKQDTQFPQALSKWIRTNNSLLWFVTTLAHDIERTLRACETRDMFRMYRWFLEDFAGIFAILEVGPSGSSGCDDRFFYIQHVISSILRTLRLHPCPVGAVGEVEVSLCIECVDFLTGMCSAAAAHAPQALGAMVPDIASTLVVFLGNVETQGPVHSFLEQLLTIDSIRDAVNKMQPFPSKYSRLELLRKSVRGEEENIAAVVETFLYHSASHQPSVSHLPGLQSLHQSLKSYSTRIQEIPTETLTRLSHHLLTLLSTLSDNSAAVRLITASLGEIGAYEVSQVGTRQQRYPPTIIQNLSAGHAVKKGDSVSLQRTEQNLAGRTHRDICILQHLEKCLKHPQGDIMMSAVSCLVGLLGRDEFDLSAVVRADFRYLHPFLTAATHDFSDSANSTWDEEEVQQSRMTWKLMENVWFIRSARVERDQPTAKLTASDYDRWIRHLVCVLMAFSATRKLRHADVIASGVLLPLCRKDTEFCEKLLPYVFYELVKNDSTNLIGPELSSGLKRFLSAMVGADFARHFFLNVICCMHDFSRGSIELHSCVHSPNVRPSRCPYCWSYGKVPWVVSSKNGITVLDPFGICSGLLILARRLVPGSAVFFWEV
eukprot:m.1163519 g.1163519  ORF g.1163519 m.1163519 type:complete len:610 (+) comp24502_c0_seq40:4869-6698(+)